MLPAQGRIARRPWWTRRRLSCPQCGQIISDADGDLMEHKHQFQCSRCGATMAMTDFWNFHHDKTSTAADLTQETDVDFEI